jgi:glycosyltransferase involved in cell wall biosynthesis
MNVLFLVPQPFYQDRGTPIAVHNALRVLSRHGDQIDVITYPEGKDVAYDGVHILRTARMPLVQGIRPGFSWKKVVCDLIMLIKVLRLVRRRQYHLVHAVEESAFIALVAKALFKIPYVYDMDSSLAGQIVEQVPQLSGLSAILRFFEGLAIRHAAAVVPVCDSLAATANQYGPRRLDVLHDVPLMEGVASADVPSLRSELNVGDVLLMYVGNLQSYQGIDLLLESFALVLKSTRRADLVIVGGEASDIQKYRRKAANLNIDQRVHFLGPKPVDDLAGYLAQADVLISPRVKGDNTPMKIYSYLRSGKALLATDLPTHSQVLDHKSALLAEPSPVEFAQAMLCLIEDEALREELGRAALALSESRHTFAAFSEKLDDLYNWLRAELEGRRDVAAVQETGRSDRDRLAA